MSEIKQKPVLRVFMPEYKFIFPYIHRELEDYEIQEVDSMDIADVAVLNPAGNISPKERAGLTILICPNVVGTGMTGVPMEIARRIAGGTYYHLAGNEARLSTLHASDVAKAVACSRGYDGVYTVTDGQNPTYHDFAEALAWRINQKRILTLSSKWVRWIISPVLRKIITKDDLYDGSGFAERFAFKANPVTEYLRTHVYDEKSL